MLKNFKLPLTLDLQFFADNGGDSVNPEAQNGENSTTGNEPASSSSEPKAIYTEEEFNKRLQEELAKVTAKYQEDLAVARTEAEKLAKMTAAEKAKYELEKREQELAAKEKELAARELRAETLKVLSDPKYNLPAEVIDLVLAKDAETTNKNIQTFKKVFDKAVQATVEERLAGKSPQVGSSSQKNTQDQIREQFSNALKGMR